MKWNYLAIIVAAALLVGCTGGGAPQPGVSLAAEQKAADQLVSEIQKEQEAALGYFAPVNFAEAKEAAYEAKTMVAEGESQADITRKLEVAKQKLQNARLSRSIVQKEMAETLGYKEKLVALNAAALYPDDFENFNDGLNEIIKKVDSGEGVESFETRAAVQAEGRELYSKAVIQGSLYKVADILNEMDAQDMVPFAPKTYAKAQDTYKNSKFTIQQFPDNEEVIAKASVTALEDAQVAQMVAKESRKVSESDEAAIEFYIVQLHGKLNEIYGKADGNTSIMTRPLPQKLGLIETKVGGMQGRLAALQNENMRQKETLAQLQGQVKSLQGSLENVEAKGGDLQKQYSAAALELSKTTKDNQRLQQDLNRTKSDLSAAQSLLVSVQGDSQKNKGDAAALRQKNQTLAEEVEALKQQVAARDAAAKAAEANVKALTKERDALKAKASEAAPTPAPAEPAPSAAPAAQ